MEKVVALCMLLNLVLELLDEKSETRLGNSLLCWLGGGRLFVVGVVGKQNLLSVFNLWQGLLLSALLRALVPVSVSINKNIFVVQETSIKVLTLVVGIGLRWATKQLG